MIEETLRKHGWSEVMRRPELGPCWEWNAGRLRSGGYGQVRLDGAPRRVHRVAFELWVGPIPEGQCVLHRCDNPPCLNPEHLFLGDRGHNARDMVAKNRIVHPVYRSSEAPSAKLTDEQVAEMRRLFGTISQAEIARRFQISESQVHRIKTGKCWSPEGSTRVVTGME